MNIDVVAGTVGRRCIGSQRRHPIKATGHRRSPFSATWATITPSRSPGCKRSRSAADTTQLSMSATLPTTWTRKMRQSATSTCVKLNRWPLTCRTWCAWAITRRNSECLDFGFCNFVGEHESNLNRCIALHAKLFLRVFATQFSPIDDVFFLCIFSNFSNYKARFSMPGGTESLFYSFNMGRVHFIAFSTEFYYVSMKCVLCSGDDSVPRPEISPGNHSSLFFVFCFFLHSTFLHFLLLNFASSSTTD